MIPIDHTNPGGPGGIQQTIDSLARTPLSQIVIFVAICSIVRLALYPYIKKTLPHHRHGIYPVARFINEAMDAVVYAGVFVFMLIRPFAVQAFLIPSGSMEQTLYVNDFIVANKAIYRYSEPKVGDIIVFRPPDVALDRNQHDMDFIKRCQGVPGDITEIRNGKLWRNGKPVDEPYISSSPGIDAEANGHPQSEGKDTDISMDWKLIHYEGTARPDLKGKYIPVQIRRGSDNVARCNYRVDMIYRGFAVGFTDGGSGRSTVTEDEWKPISGFTPIEWQYERELEAAPPAAVPKGFVLMMGDNRNYSYDGRSWGLVPREDVIGRSEIVWLPVGRWRITR